jgi:hypothetical protein
VLADVGETFGHEVERGHLEALRQPRPHLNVQPHWHRTACGKLLERDRQSMTADDGRMETARDGAEFLQRCCDLAPSPIKPLTRFGVVVQFLLEQPKLE